MIPVFCLSLGVRFIAVRRSLDGHEIGCVRGGRFPHDAGFDTGAERVIGNREGRALGHGKPSRLIERQKSRRVFHFVAADHNIAESAVADPAKHDRVVFRLAFLIGAVLDAHIKGVINDRQLGAGSALLRKLDRAGGREAAVFHGDVAAARAAEPQRVGVVGGHLIRVSVEGAAVERKAIRAETAILDPDAVEGAMIEQDGLTLRL